MVALAAAALTLVLTDVLAFRLDRPTLEGAVAAALVDSGLELRWDTTPPGAERRFDSSEVRVILLDRHPRSGAELILGSVLRQHARTAALWVYVGDIRRVIDGGAPGRSNRLQMSVAVGRVIAHEVAHLVAPEQPHAGQGLMSRMVTRAVLLQAEAPLDADCRAAMRSALAIGLGPPLAGAAERSFTVEAFGGDLGGPGLAR
ncbi:MAG TPA: hypothetical protein VKA01_02295 [Vicinamibacteria bacterium]|nr:hypothetical protein [Vicinamibacteria bacterium]